MAEPDEPMLLVVDDEPEINKLVARIFEKRGYRVTTALDGAEALASVKRDRPDLIMLDLNLPKIDGWDGDHRQDSCNKIAIGCRISELRRNATIGSSRCEKH